MPEELMTMLVIGLPTAFLASGVIIVIAGMWLKARTLDMQHRERLAMIERGLTPPPELSPTGTVGGRRVAPVSSRSRSLGIVVVGIGFAFMSLIGIAARAPFEALGIGGAIVILGAAFLVRAQFAGQAQPHQMSDPAIPPPPPSPTKDVSDPLS